MTLLSFLSSLEPFRRLPPHELDRLASAAQEAAHLKGEFIYTEGEKAKDVLVLQKGRVEIYKYTAGGRPQAIEIVNPGDIYGTLCRLGTTEGRYICTAVTAIESVSVVIPDDLFRSLFMQYPAMVQSLCLLCSARLRAIQNFIISSQDRVEKRIVRTLFQLSKTNGTTLPFTKREIADFSATTVESAIRTLSQFQKRKWISSTRGQIVLKDIDKLQARLL